MWVQLKSVKGKDIWDKSKNDMVWSGQQIRPRRHQNHQVHMTANLLSIGKPQTIPMGTGQTRENSTTIEHNFICTR